MKIGIVNDLAMAREALRRVVVSSPGHQVVWLAADGSEAVDRARRDPPDLILMDLIMPGVNGVEATRRIMTECPCPILIVTATVSGNCSKVYEAMGLGALDAVDTPTLGLHGNFRGGDELLSKIAIVGKLTGKAECRTSNVTLHPPRRSNDSDSPPLVAIGASTGGPSALAEVISAFPKRWDAAVILIQHVDVAFAPGLAHWLSERSGHRVEIAEAGARPIAGQILLAATNDHLVCESGPRLYYVSEPHNYCYRPSVDVFFESVAAHWSGLGVAVLLTGMGRDGARGMLTLRRAGWQTIAQDAATSVVWGMPRAAAEFGAAAEVLPLRMIGPAVVELVRNRARKDENRP